MGLYFRGSGLSDFLGAASILRIARHALLLSHIISDASNQADSLHHTTINHIINFVHVIRHNLRPPLPYGF